MPVTAASAPYNPVPSVEPNVQQPNRYQDIRPDPNAFGANIGAAETGLGRDIAQAGNVLADAAIRQQEQYNQITADDSSNQFSNIRNKLLYGDPDTGQTGFYQLHGRDAMDAFPGTRDSLDKSLQEIRGNLKNPKQQLMFDQETRRIRDYTLSEMGRHYDQQMQQYGIATYTAKSKNAEQGAAAASVAGNTAEWEQRVGEWMHARIQLLHQTGEDGPDQIKAALEDIRASAVKDRVLDLALKDPLAAQKFLDNNIDAVKPGEYPQLIRGLREQAKLQQGYIDNGLLPEHNSGVQPSFSSPRSGGWGPLAKPVMETWSNAGASPEFIQAGLAAGLAEGGFKNSWQKAWGDKENSFGHWQFNEGGELPGFQKAFAGDKSSEAQAKYFIRRLEEISPGISKSHDAEKILDVINTQFEKYQGYGPGQRRDFLDLVRRQLGTETPSTTPQPQLPIVNAAASGPDTLVGTPNVSRPLPELDPGAPADSEVPGLKHQLEMLDKKIPNDGTMESITRWNTAVKVARQQFGLQYTAQQQQKRLDDQQHKAQEQTLDDQFLKRMASPNPPTVSEILTSPQLETFPELKRKLISFVERENKQDPAAPISKTNTTALFSKMSLPDGNVDKLTTEAPINQAYVDQALTRQDHDWLIKQFRDQRTPGHETQEKTKTAWLNSAKYKILGPFAEGEAGLIDPERHAKYFNYIQAVDAKLAELSGRPGGNWRDAFNPGAGKDYVGGDDFMKPYLPKIGPGTAAIAAPLPGAPKPLDLSSKEAILGAADQGKLSREDALKALEKLGYKRRPTPPMAQ